MKEVTVDNGKIILKNLKNLLHIEYINCKVPQAESAAHIAINAPQVLGYKFVCWVNVSTQGFVKSCYIDMPDIPNANIWFTQSTMDINSNATSAVAYALYVKD